MPIAVMGTAFTDQHVHTLTATVPAKRIIVALDNDQAGRTATITAGEKLTAAGWTVRIPRPIDGKDPAEISAARGADVVRWLHPRACRPLIYLAAEHHVQDFGPLEFPEHKLQAAQATWAYLNNHYPNDPNLRRATDYVTDLCGLPRPEPHTPQRAERPPHDTAAVRRTTVISNPGYSR